MRFGQKNSAIVLLLGLVNTQVSTGSDFEADPGRGEEIYAQCKGCHSLERHRTGPMHCGLIGRRAGTVPGFQYSKAMCNADIEWSTENLDQFLYAPLEFVPGTSMTIDGIKNDQDRLDLISYLVLINEQPVCH